MLQSPSTQSRLFQGEICKLMTSPGACEISQVLDERVPMLGPCLLEPAWCAIVFMPPHPV